MRRWILGAALLLSAAVTTAAGVESYWRCELVAVHPGGRFAWEARSLSGTELIAVGWIAPDWPRYAKWQRPPSENTWTLLKIMTDLACDPVLLVKPFV